MNGGDVISLDISKVRELLKSLDDDERAKATGVFESLLNRSLIKPDRELTHTKVRGFKLEGRSYKANSHIDVFRQVLQIIFREFPGEEHKLLSIPCRKRKYFSEHFDDLRMPEQVPGTDIYFETNENAKSLQVRCETVLKLYGMDYLSFEIDYYR